MQIRIYPTAVDLSPFGLNLSNNRSRSPAGAARPRTPGRPPSPMMPDDGECEFLGVHPIVKKPPLAVITLSSEDENEDGNHNQTVSISFIYIQSVVINNSWLHVN